MLKSISHKDLTEDLNPIELHLACMNPHVVPPSAQYDHFEKYIRKLHKNDYKHIFIAYRNNGNKQWVEFHSFTLHLNINSHFM